jgi:chlorobactene glucosyltransferase
MSPLLVVYHVLVLAVLFGSLAMVLANLACFDGLRPVPPFGTDAPFVSILVPARDEALNIEPCVRSLLVQDYPNFELLVLDDHSEDATAELVRGLGVSETGDRERLVRGAELPAGWVGKNWACHQLAQQARGDFLFFTDADTEHTPGTVAAAVAYAQQHRADLVSAWPRLITKTLGEQLIIPIIMFLAMIVYPHWLVLALQRRARPGVRLPARIRRALGAANGQFMFFTRAGYERIGGHAALRDHVVEDVAFGRAVASRMHEGMRLFNCESIQFSTCRMYRSFRETWQGFTKNGRAAFEDSLSGFLGIGLILTICFVFPFIIVWWPGAGREFVLADVVLIYLIRVLICWRFRTSWLGAALHPVGLVLGLAIGMNSWWRSSRGGVTWKGRTYVVSARD